MTLSNLKLNEVRDLFAQTGGKIATIVGDKDNYLYNKYPEISGLKISKELTFDEALAFIKSAKLNKQVANTESKAQHNFTLNKVEEINKDLINSFLKENQTTIELKELISLFKITTNDVQVDTESLFYESPYFRKFGEKDGREAYFAKRAQYNTSINFGSQADLDEIEAKNKGIYKILFQVLESLNINLDKISIELFRFDYKTQQIVKNEGFANSIYIINNSDLLKLNAFDYSLARTFVNKVVLSIATVTI